jgi:hypothetical protein
MMIRDIAAAILVIAIQACTLSGSDQRGDLSLQGTIFEGFTKMNLPEDVDASQIEGAYYSCRRAGLNGGSVQFACVLKLADGDNFDGTAFQESVEVQYGDSGSPQTVEIKTTRPPETSEDHFLFAITSAVAERVVAIKSNAPVVLNSK